MEKQTWFSRLISTSKDIKTEEKTPMTSQLGSYDMEGHAQKCVEPYYELTHKTIDQLHKVSTLFFRRSPEKEKIGNCMIILIWLVSDCVEMHVFGKRWKTTAPGKTSYTVESSMRSLSSTSHTLHSSHEHLQGIISTLGIEAWNANWDYSKTRFCRKFAELKVNLSLVFCASLDHKRFEKNKWLYPMAALKLKLCRMMQGYPWRVFQH